MSGRNGGYSNEEMETRGRSLVESLIIARKWNAIHGGVFVEKTVGIESNPFLQEQEITSVDGKVYSKRNPAFMLREISDLSQGSDLAAFRITSTNPLNPANAPDAFERAGFDAFVKGRKEYFEKNSLGSKTSFKYMKPLFTDDSCLYCHQNQSYRVGDVRGAISVSFDITETERSLSKNFVVIASLSVASTGSLLALLYTAFALLKKRLALARESLEAMAHMDSLTGVSNRRHLFEHFKDEISRSNRKEHPLSCVMIDIDHFKSINDQYGHLVGDTVLRELAAIILETIRPYDHFGRFGGEEFFLVLPDTDIKSALTIAERIKIRIQNELAQRSGLDVGKIITVSQGLTCLREGDASIGDLVERADTALYAAKTNGRNRIEQG